MVLPMITRTTPATVNNVPTTTCLVTRSSPGRNTYAISRVINGLMDTMGEIMTTSERCRA